MTKDYWKLGAKVLGQAFSELKAILFTSKMNVFLVLLPLAVISAEADWPPAVTFTLSLLPLCSLAERLGFVTEELAAYTNDTLGGLLNASFGNATEVIIAAFALGRGRGDSIEARSYRRIVQLTLLGSIISNLLLVLGSAFIAGGVYHPTQRFNQQGINVNCGLLVLAVVAVALPSLLTETKTGVKAGASELYLSRFESVLMFVCYLLFLWFQLKTHRFLYEEAPSSDGQDNEQQEEGQCKLASRRLNGQTYNSLDVELSTELAAVKAVVDKDASAPPTQEPVIIENKAETPMRPAMEVLEEDEEPVLSKPGCFIWLGIVTLLIALLSDYIMEVISRASKQLRVPMPFLTTILVPIIGNAAEHASAIVFAYKNRMEISLGVAVGSSTQVGVLVMPFCVLLGWCMGVPLDFSFNAFEMVALFISVLLAVIVVQDGTSNWLKGAMLLITYLYMAGGFWVHHDVDLTGS